MMRVGTLLLMSWDIIADESWDIVDVSRDVVDESWDMVIDESWDIIVDSWEILMRGGKF